MSDLELLFNQFIHIIVDYQFSQTNQPYPIDNLLTQPNEEVANEIKQLITLSTPEGYQTRKSFLEYLATIITTWRETIKQTEPLSEEREAQLQNTLIQCLHTCQILLKLSDSKIHTIEHNEQSIDFHGFNNGLFQDSLGRIGQIINKRIFEYLELSTSYNPSGTGLSKMVNNLISAHQRLREKSLLTLQLATYLAANEILYKDRAQLIATEKRLTDENEALKEEIISIQHTPPTKHSFGQLTSAIASKASDLLFFSSPIPSSARHQQLTPQPEPCETDRETDCDADCEDFDSKLKRITSAEYF